MSEDIHKWTDGRYTLMFDEHTFFVLDNEKEKRMTALQVTKKLNEQQAIIKMYKRRVNELKQEVKQYWAYRDIRKQKIKDLEEQLNLLQNLISDAIQHQKTELGQKVLKEIIRDYNEFLLGHKGVE